MTRAERYERTVEAALVCDSERDAERERHGLSRLGPSLVLTPEQTDALHAGSLDLADVLPSDPWTDLFGVLGADYATRISEACEGEWERLSDFGIRRRVYWPGRGEWERWRARRVPEERKRRADRKRSDRKRRRRVRGSRAARAQGGGVIRLMTSHGRPVEPIEHLRRVPQTGDRIETFDGPMVVTVVVCETVHGRGGEGVWRVDLERADLPTRD